MMSLCRAGSDARRGLQCANSANSGCIRGRKRGYSLGIAEKREPNSASIRSVFPLLARLPGKCSTPCCTPASARRLPGGGCGRSCTCRHTCNFPGCEVRGKKDTASQYWQTLRGLWREGDGEAGSGEEEGGEREGGGGGGTGFWRRTDLQERELGVEVKERWFMGRESISSSSARNMSMLILDSLKSRSVNGLMVERNVLSSSEPKPLHSTTHYFYEQDRLFGMS